MALEQTVAVGNPTGFHLRSVKKLIELVRGLDATVTLAANGKTAAVRDPMRLLTLGATHGCPVTVRAEGPAAAAALAAVVHFLEEDRT